MNVEFDPDKSAANLKKQGTGFLEAQALWEDADRLLVPARTQGGPRHMLVGKTGQKHWSAIFTYRGEAVRIISVRRARKEEVDAYEN
ncbi:MAG TPA: BrnT family toxin [Kiritimatiellia bacterium]|nr:BrnT family toxin [Kiritimatiellia bacterium]HOR97922.1 BrnT family toxin [Kiritimatiellia bacterium]HPK37327.1 BrnT family toxin [Kiritimatiellia bacterium]HPW74986.1 BrnT family toxin [Kiritimatiellia bacterium]HRU19969.1 BrnT family toxin [Kiritimatiellia bacterium]